MDYKCAAFLVVFCFTARGGFGCFLPVICLAETNHCGSSKARFAMAEDKRAQASKVGAGVMAGILHDYVEEKQVGDATNTSRNRTGMYMYIQTENYNPNFNFRDR